MTHAEFCMRLLLLGWDKTQQGDSLIWTKHGDRISMLIGAPGLITGMTVYFKFEYYRSEPGKSLKRFAAHGYHTLAMWADHYDP